MINPSELMMLANRAASWKVLQVANAVILFRWTEACRVSGSQSMRISRKEASCSNSS